MAEREARSLMGKAVQDSPLTLKSKDEKYAYRWVNMANVEKRKAQGYVVVQRGNNTKEVPVGQTHVNDGSSIRYQTLVLMKMPIEKYQERKKKKLEYAKLQAEAIEKQYMDTARKNKVKTVKEKEID